MLTIGIESTPLRGRKNPFYGSETPGLLIFRCYAMCDAYPLPVLPASMKRRARGSPIRNTLK